MSKSKGLVDVSKHSKLIVRGLDGVKIYRKHHVWWGKGMVFPATSIA